MILIFLLLQFQQWSKYVRAYVNFSRRQMDCGFAAHSAEFWELWCFSTPALQCPMSVATFWSTFRRFYTKHHIFECLEFLKWYNLYRKRIATEDSVSNDSGLEHCDRLQQQSAASTAASTRRNVFSCWRPVDARPSPLSTIPIQGRHQPLVHQVSTLRHSRCGVWATVRWVLVTVYKRSAASAAAVEPRWWRQPAAREQHVDAGLPEGRVDSERVLPVTGRSSSTTAT